MKGIALLAWLVAGGVVVARWFIRPLRWPWLVALVVAGGIGFWLDAKSGRTGVSPIAWRVGAPRTFAG